MEFTPREKTEIASLTLAMTWFTEYLPYYIVVNRIFSFPSPKSSPHGEREG
jgi:hypothetical protein